MENSLGDVDTLIVVWNKDFGTIYKWRHDLMEKGVKDFVVTSLYYNARQLGEGVI